MLRLFCEAVELGALHLAGCQASQPFAYVAQFMCSNAPSCQMDASSSACTDRAFHTVQAGLTDMSQHTVNETNYRWYPDYASLHFSSVTACLSWDVPRSNGWLWQFMSQFICMLHHFNALTPQ